MNIKFIKLIFIIILSISLKVNTSENIIIFKINEKAFTSFDYEERLKYLDFVGNNQDLNKETIINDFISSNIFFEYFLNSGNKNEFNTKINEIYNNILEINQNNNKIYQYEINKDNIFYNIKIDFVRKTILENILRSNIEDLNRANEELDLIYNFEITYYNLEIKNKIEILNKINSIENINENKVELFFKNNNLTYFKKNNEVNNISKIDRVIRQGILSNQKFLIIENNNKLSIVLIKKEFETFDGIIAELYTVKTDKILSADEVSCEKINNLKQNINIVSKEYKFSNLNEKIKKNLISINDYLEFKNNDEIIYVVLCDIKFDKEILKNINFNKLISQNVSNIENKFLDKYSKIYNLKIFND